MSQRRRVADDGEGGVRRVAHIGAQDLSEFMSDAKLRACSCGTEIRLAWKFEKAAPKTTSVIVDPAGLVDTGVVVTQPVIVAQPVLLTQPVGVGPVGASPHQV